MMKKMMMSLLTVCATLSAAPEAIVFDFGGVMTKEQNREVLVRFLCESFGLTSEEFEAVNQEKRQAVKAGQRDQDFWLEYAQQHGVLLPQDWEEAFNEKMKEAIGINQEMYDLVYKLKEKGIPVALLSNIDERLARILKEYNLYAPFNPCLLSCEIGLEKPDPKIYGFLIKELELPAAEVVFIDDREENIESALHVGLDAILFSSQEQLEAELKKRGLSVF